MEENKPEADNQFEVRAFGRDALTYSTGTILLFIFGLIQAFLIPKYLSLESYGYWQLFCLYSSYAGILHVGFCDGILVRWAGKRLGDIGDEVRVAFRFLLLEQVVAIIPLGLLIYFLLTPPYQWIGLIILPFAFTVNLTTFFRFTAQSIKKFPFLTAVSVGRGLIQLIIVVGLFVSGSLNYQYVIIATLIAHIIAVIVFTFRFRQDLSGKMPAFSSLLSFGYRNIGVGIFILLGNFVVDLFLTIDRLMVSFFFELEQFAVYALALSVALMANTVVRAISDVFFPYLSGAAIQFRSQAYQIGKSAIIIAGAAILAAYFPVVLFIEFYLPRYTGSLPMMQILLCSVGLNSLIQILHTNYYKISGLQREYFLWAIASLVISVILNYIAIEFWGTLTSVAIATVISVMIWYVVNEIRLKQTVEQTNKQIMKGIGIIICYIGVFWLSFLLSEGLILQMLIYIAFFLILTWLFFHNEVKMFVAGVKGIRNKRE